MNTWIFKRFLEDLIKDSKELFVNLYENTVEIFQEVFYYFPRKMHKFVKRVIEYTPLLWNDCDYDYSSILNMLSYKIKRTRDHMREHNIIVNNEKYCKQMDKALEILERIQKDNYHGKAYEQELKEKWGRRITLTEDKDFSDKNEKKHLGTRVVFTRENVNYTNEKEYIKDFKKVMKKADRIAEKDWNNLWDILNKNMRNWWD